MITKALKYSRRISRSDEGSIMLLGLAILGLLVVPLTAILYFASLTSSATVTARGVAFSSAYAGLSRSIDPSSTLTAQQPQLFGVGSPELGAAASETQTAVQNSWVYSGIGRQLPGANLSMKTLPAWGGYSPGSGGQALGGLGTVNIPVSPAKAFQKASQDGTTDCRSTGNNGWEVVGGVTSCWVDHRATEVHASRNVPQGGSDADSWDHYSSGVETQLELTMPLFVAGLPTKRPLFRASASFAQPCLGNDCAQ